MRNQLFTLLILAAFSSCGGPNCNKPTKPADTVKTAAPAVVGADKDEHGCKASAGYQWSELQQNCIRAFELPIQIFNKDSTTKTGLIINADRSRAEVFAPSGHFLLKRTIEFQYESEDSAKPAKLFISNKGEWVFEVK